MGRYRPNSDLIAEETFEGFTIRFYVEPEDTDPADCFDTIGVPALQQDVDAIRAGNLLWFQVECVAVKEGVELGADYLGGCAYETYADFLTPDGYAADMRRAAVDEAKATIAKLCAA